MALFWSSLLTFYTRRQNGLLHVTDKAATAGNFATTAAGSLSSSNFTSARRHRRLPSSDLKQANRGGRRERNYKEIGAGVGGSNLIIFLAASPLSRAPETAMLRRLRELKQTRRRRKRQSQKNNCFYEQNNSFARASHFLSTFLWLCCVTTTWNPLMRLFMEDVNIRRRIFLSRFETG